MRSGAHGVVGYVGAVIAASATYVLISMVYLYRFHEALSMMHPPWERMGQFVTMSFLIFLIVTLFLFFTAFPWVWMTHKIAERFAINRIWFYGVCGIFVAIILVGSALHVGQFYFPSEPDPDAPSRAAPGVLERAIYLGLFSIPGLAGGIVYWLLTGRFIGRDVSVGVG